MPRRVDTVGCSSSFLILSRDTGRPASGFLSLPSFASSVWDGGCEGEDGCACCADDGEATRIAVNSRAVRRMDIWTPWPRVRPQRWASRLILHVVRQENDLDAARFRTDALARR